MRAQVQTKKPCSSSPLTDYTRAIAFGMNRLRSHVTVLPCGAVRLVTEVAERPEDAENAWRTPARVKRAASASSERSATSVTKRTWLPTPTLATGVLAYAPSQYAKCNRPADYTLSSFVRQNWSAIDAARPMN
jgi:hypothetical protein